MTIGMRLSGYRISRMLVSLRQAQTDRELALMTLASLRQAPTDRELALMTPVSLRQAPTDRELALTTPSQSSTGSD